MIQPKIITVIGANGTMGCLVSGILASFGAAKVYMVCRDEKKANEAYLKAAQSVKADSIKVNLVPATYEMLKDCIEESDWIFESAAESYEVKNEINQLINQYAREGTIISTGTSGLSINQLSENLNDNLKKYYIGTHFFNPPYNLTLCEVIPTVHTDRTFLTEFKTYLQKKLYRSVVQVADEAGFLGNRIGFQFINEVLQFAEQYKEYGGIDYMDAILGPFTGRSMAPLVTTDFVGLDVHKAIVDNILVNTSDYANKSFVLPQYVEELIKQNKLGRKTGEGLYKRVTNAEGKSETWVYDIITKRYRPKGEYAYPFITDMIMLIEEGQYEQAFNRLIEDESLEANIGLSLLLKYIIYSITLCKNIGEDVNDADIVMAEGFNWIPPLGVVELLGGVTHVKDICQKKLQSNFLDNINLDYIFDDIPKSKYDYRRYLKAKK